LPVYDSRRSVVCFFCVSHSVPLFFISGRMMQESMGRNNAQTLFGVHEIPTDACIRILLDPVAPQHCFSVFTDVHEMLAERGKLEEEYRTVEGTYLMALDGTWFHRRMVNALTFTVR